MDTLSGIGVLDKTVAILDAVAQGPCSLRTLVDRTGISRATAHRLAGGMETLGLLRRTDDGSYALGLALIPFGRVAADELPLTTVARPVLRWLRDEVGESAQLFVVDDGARLCVAAVDSTNELRTTVPVGARLPLAVGSAGRVLSGEIGIHGWTASVAERAPGVASVSAPVRDGGEIVGAVSLSGPIERLSTDPGERLGAPVVAAATEIERALAGGA